MPTYPDNSDDVDEHHPIESEQHRQIDHEVSITFNSNTETYHVTVDSVDEIPLSVTIIQVIAEITQTDPFELDPLIEYIDSDGLERLYNPDRYTSDSQSAVSFSYADHQITVETATKITISL